MAAESELRPAAEEDLNRAFDWYEAEHPGLGDDFYASFERSLRMITQNPEIYATVRRRYRRCLLRRFPYAVYYSYADDLVIVHAVLHTARDSRLVRRRLP